MTTLRLFFKRLGCAWKGHAWRPTKFDAVGAIRRGVEWECQLCGAKSKHRNYDA